MTTTSTAPHGLRFAAALVLAICLGARPAQAAPPPPEVFFKEADIVEAVLSPSGRRLAITSAQGATRVGLVLLDLGPGGQMRRIAQFEDGDVAQVRWVNEERLVFGITDLSEGSGRANGAPGLYSINTDGKQLRGAWWIRDDISSSARQYALPEMIGDPDKDAAPIAANSPVKLAGRIKAPVLLAFGEDDRRVPLAHGKCMREALRDAGNDPAWVSYPGEGHGFAVLKNRLDFARRLEAFLAQHLQR